MGNGMTIGQMMGGKANRGTGPVPTQTFYASNIAGTTVPKVGAAQTTSGASNAGAAAGVSPTMVAVIVIAFIGGGYLLHHLTFEEGIRVG